MLIKIIAITLLISMVVFGVVLLNYLANQIINLHLVEVIF